MTEAIGDVGIEQSGHVAVVELQRPPHNFFDPALIDNIAEAFDRLDETPDCRAIVLAAQGKSFCAGADFQGAGPGGDQAPNETVGTMQLYREAVRLFSNKKPIIGAIQGPAIGGGLGLSLVPDFRVASAKARFAANFTKLGFHPGFGLTHTLPRLIGQQKAALMFYTGRRLDGATAYEWGLADLFTGDDDPREAAVALAQEIAENAPLAVMSTRATMRAGLAAAVAQQTDHELVEQTWLRATDDHKEGVASVLERRKGDFKGR